MPSQLAKDRLDYKVLSFRWLPASGFKFQLGASSPGQRSFMQPEASSPSTASDTWIL